MLILGAILLGLLATVALVAYLSVIVALWLMAIVFIVFAISIAYIVGDAYLGSLLAIPATALTVWWVVRGKDRSKSDKEA